MERKITSLDLIQSITNQELKNLMLELKIMSKSKAPALLKKTPLMKSLFESEKTPHNYWSDQYNNVDQSVRIEIVKRFVDGVIS